MPWRSTTPTPRHARYRAGYTVAAGVFPIRRPPVLTGKTGQTEPGTEAARRPRPESAGKTPTTSPRPKIATQLPGVPGSGAADCLADRRRSGRLRRTTGSLLPVSSDRQTRRRMSHEIASPPFAPVPPPWTESATEARETPSSVGGPQTTRPGRAMNSSSAGYRAARIVHKVWPKPTKMKYQRSEPDALAYKNSVKELRVGDKKKSEKTWCFLCKK